MNMATEHTDEPTMGPSTDAAPPPASPRNAAVHLDAPGMAPGAASVAAATAVSGATTSTAAAGSSNAAASAAVAADEVHATEAAATAAAATEAAAAAAAGVAATFTTSTGSAARTCGASDTKETPEAVGKVQVVGVVDGEDEERKRSRWREEEEGEGAEVSLAGGGKGGAGAQAAAAVAGSVERTTMPQQDGGESKEKRKGKAKSCPFRIVEERAAAGPCLCPQDSDGAHKTVEIARRCWPGSNKPGGTARITKKFEGEEDVYGETLRYTYFDVKYLLGGSEKGVKETFITCTPLETAARQSAPREIFTVEVPEPARRRQVPKVAPTRTSPLGTNAVRTTLSSSSSAAVKAKAVGAVKKAATTKKSKATAEAEVEGVKERSQKRARISDRRETGGGKVAKENREIRQQREVPAEYNEPVPHAINDLSVAAEAEKEPDAPLSEERMRKFQAALSGLFYEDTIQRQALTAGINSRAGAETFEEGEVTAALDYLQQLSKIMVDSGVIYRI